MHQRLQTQSWEKKYEELNYYKKNSRTFDYLNTFHDLTDMLFSFITRANILKNELVIK